MSKPERDFKGIWIPKEIWLNETLSMQEKLFLVEIDSLDDEQRGCYANNEYFAKFFFLSKSRCSEVIKSLEEKGLITITYTYKQGSKEIESRSIRVFGKSNAPFEKPFTPLRETVYPPSEKAQENNTKINNTKSNIKPLCATELARFNKFYSAYPKKRNKADAEKAFKKLNPDDILLNEILSAINVAIASEEWRKDGGKYIPYPASWLNAKGWADEYSPQCYTERELSVMNVYAETMRDPWPRVVTNPYCPSRAFAIQEFLSLSPKEDMPRRYFEHVAETIAARDGCGFDWLIKRETYLKIREDVIKPSRIHAHATR